MDSTTAPDLDEVFGLLRSARRRFVLHYLRHRTGTSDVSELAAALATREADDGAGSTEQAREKLKISLRHAHLPKLAEAGIVSYERRTDRVTLADAAVLDPYLAETEQVDRPVPGDPADDD